MKHTKEIVTLTILATIIEWLIYYTFNGYFGITVSSSKFLTTIIFMLITNFISAMMAKYIFIGKK